MAAVPISWRRILADEFRSTSAFLRIGAEDDHAEKMRTLIIAMADQNFDAIRSRAMRDIKIQAAQAGEEKLASAGSEGH